MSMYELSLGAKLPCLWHRISVPMAKIICPILPSLKMGKTRYHTRCDFSTEDLEEFCKLILFSVLKYKEYTTLLSVHNFVNYA